MRKLAGVIGWLYIAGVAATPTWRLDFEHIGGGGAQEKFEKPQLVQEPVAWQSPLTDTLLRGDYKVELFYQGEPLPWFSQSYNSIYSDWAAGVDAISETARFAESVRFPKPVQDSTLVISARQLHTEGQPFLPVWQTKITSDAQPIHATIPAAFEIRALLTNGDSSKKLDLVFVAEGFTATEKDKFFTAANNAMTALFSYEPYAELKQSFNVHALYLPSQSSGLGGDTALNVNPNGLGMPRYALTTEMHKLRNAVMVAPYENIVILTNSDKYSASGIFGAYAVVPAYEPNMAFLLVHELGHHLAGLADEYFHETPGYAAVSNIIEPHQPNITTLQNSPVKWAKWIKNTTPIPTPWQKERYLQNLQGDLSWMANEPYATEVGAFEGANYSPSHFYRPTLSCLMLRNDADNRFCPICTDAIRDIIRAASDEEFHVKPLSLAHRSHSD